MGDPLFFLLFLAGTTHCFDLTTTTPTTLCLSHHFLYTLCAYHTTFSTHGKRGKKQPKISPLLKLQHVVLADDGAEEVRAACLGFGT
jgi:hypothetical protein